MYYGFEVFVALSSNIVRYFLELCEQAFKIAFLSGYAWDNSISPEVQTEAARYVSEYKVVDIAGYEPYGKELLHIYTVSWPNFLSPPYRREYNSWGTGAKSF